MNRMRENVTYQNSDLLATLSGWLSTQGTSDRYIPDSLSAWDEFTRAAIEHGVAGLILDRSQKTAVKIPKSALDTLRQAAMTVAAYNMRLICELEDLVCAMNQAAIPVLLLKGAALNLTLYPKVNQRPMTDLDLLIQPSDVNRTSSVLAKAGYVPGVALIRDDFFPRFYHETEWISQSASPVRIDLHARPFRPLRIAQTMPDDALFDNAKTVAVGNGQALIPNDEHMLIHLAAHAAFHGCNRLIWLYDIKRFVEQRAYTIDWDMVTQKCHEWKLAPAVLAAIRKATTLLGPFCPEPVISELERRSHHWKDRLILRHAPRDAASPIGHVAVNLLTTPGIIFKLQYVKALLFPGKAHLSELYHRTHLGWTICAHLSRIARLIKRAIPKPIQTG